MSDRSGASKEEVPTVEASHHPEIKADPPDVKETTDETLSRLRKNPVMTEIGKKNLVETRKKRSVVNTRNPNLRTSQRPSNIQLLPLAILLIQVYNMQ